MEPLHGVFILSLPLSPSLSLYASNEREPSTLVASANFIFSWLTITQNRHDPWIFCPRAGRVGETSSCHDAPHVNNESVTIFPWEANALYVAAYVPYRCVEKLTASLSLEQNRALKTWASARSVPEREAMDFFQCILLIGYFALFGMCSSLVVCLRYKRHEAFQGDANAARKLILPAFEPLLWIMTFLSGMTFVPYVLFGQVNFALVPQWVVYFFRSCNYFVFLIIPVLVLQKSISKAALRRACAITVLIATHQIPIEWAAHKLMASGLTPSEFDLVTYALLAFRLAIILSYVYVLVRPPARASKRTLREHCVCVGIYHGMQMVVFYFAERREKQTELFYVSCVWGLFIPVMVWRVLRTDTEHWRGLGQSACALQRNKSLAGMSITERISSDGLHVLIEMHRKHIIDFAALNLKHKIGVGASSNVYQGILHSKTLAAVKVYTPKEFTNEVIASFSHEAALCGSLHHPNIVAFHGMCVCPPTICLVSELCQGSLDHITMAMADTVDRAAGHASSKREHVLINLGFMLDAARSVAHLHSFSPAFVHRDIKPSNFLVDFDNNVKLTDFGESRCLPRSSSSTATLDASSAGATAMGKCKGASAHADEMDPSSTSSSPQTTATSASGMSSQARLSSHSIRSSGRQQLAWDITVKGTVDYMAPEVIQGRAGLASYGEAADIYSLGITFWDILHPRQEKFPHYKNNHLHIFEAILDGERPKLDPRNADRYADLYHVIELAWQSEPEQRPSAQQLVMLLERIQEQECAQFARNFSYDVLAHMDPETFSSVSRRGSSHVSEDDFHVRGQQRVQTTGHHAVVTMLQQQVVQSRPEAIRLGSLLMDAGVLHHVKHGRPFEDNGSASSSQVYYFDHNCIQMYEPPTISILEEGPTPEQREDLATTAGMKRTTHGFLHHDTSSALRLPPRALQTVRADADSTALLSDCPSRPCGCRALSQRLQQPKMAMCHKVFRRFKGSSATMTTPLLEAHSLTTNLLFTNDDARYDGGALDEDDDGGSFTVHVQE
ncbi:Tkl protein kinase, partial [Globisporangium splendens]